MQNLSNIVSNILSKANYLCCLCYHVVDENAIRVHDEVALNMKHGKNTEEMVKILTFVLGAEFSDNMLSDYDSFCETCTRTAINSYKFILMCKENSTHLTNAVDTLNDCFETTIDDVNIYKSLVVSLDTNHSTSEQYYDVQRLDNSSAALKRFKAMMCVKKRLKSTKPRERKQKQHNFNAELLDICDLIVQKSNPTQFKCKVCSHIFKKSFNFKKHYYSQHSPKVLKCSECPRSYGSETLLRQHKYDCHSSLICSECGKRYTNRYSLLYHKRQHTGEQPFECSFCGMKFHWSSRKAEHVRRFHKEPSLECKICHNKYRTLGSLYEHRKRHFNPKSRLHVPQKGELIEEQVEIYEDINVIEYADHVSEVIQDVDIVVQ